MSLTPTLKFFPSHEPVIRSADNLVRSRLACVPSGQSCPRSRFMVTMRDSGIVEVSHESEAGASACCRLKPCAGQERTGVGIRSRQGNAGRRKSTASLRSGRLLGQLLLFLILLASATLARSGEVIDPAKATRKPGEGMLWYDIKLLGVEGRGWNDTKAFYDRLPAKAEGVVPGVVWSLSQHSAGMCVRFVTDATTLHARWAVTGKNLAMPHMAATGVSGVDLYVRTVKDKWHWLAVGQPKLYPTNTAQLVQGIPPGKREFLLYLPLYNGTASVEIGIPKESRLEQAGPWGPGERKPIVFYGTSITHGACASRTGMPHPAILGRRFNYPTINLGFSGSGKMEPEMAALLAELDPSVYVLDCLPNMTADLVSERVEPFVRTLRRAHPHTPIVLAEDRTYGDSFLVPSKRERNETSRAALRPIYDQLTKAGVKGLYYVKGDALLGDDGEATVDSSHPNDLGFMRQADAFARVLGPLLRK